MNIFGRIVPLTWLCFSIAPLVTAKDATDKLVVYNAVTKHSDPAAETMAKEKYSGRFQIIDLTDTKSFSDPKCVDCQLMQRPRDGSGDVVAGKVLVTWVVSSGGRVLDPVVLESSDARLNEVTLSQIKAFRFNPAQLNGTPVAALMGHYFVSEKPKPQEKKPGFAYANGVDAKGIIHWQRNDPDGLAPWLEDLTAQVRIAPGLNSDRIHEGEGLGVYRVFINLKTGAVTDVAVVKSTEHEVLDNNARTALRQARWKPGKWKQVDIPVQFGSPGPVYSSGNDAPRSAPTIQRGFVR